MTDELDDLRDTWLNSHYETARDSYRNSLGSLDIEQLTLLEYTSYEYERSKGPQRQQDKGFYLKEAAFRSELRNQRRLKLEDLMRDIIADKRSIYGISHEHQDNSRKL